MKTNAVSEDIAQVRLPTLSHIRGQPQVTNALELHLQGHFAMQSICGTSSTAAGPFLLAGPSGTGKTMVAKVIHSELRNRALIETNGQVLNSRQELFLTLIHADANTTIFIDEAQAMGHQVQHILLTALSEGVLRVPARAGSTYSHTVQLAPFTMILATTHEYLLQDALRNRMRACCRFDYYSVADLVEIVRQYAEALKWGYQCDTVLEAIAQRAKGTPRLALHRNLRTCWYATVKRGSTTITLEDARTAFRCLQIDALGLDQLDRSYLEVLLKHGPTAAGVLAARLLLPTQTLQRVVEPYLLRTELITKDRSSRRAITEQGRCHIESNSP